MIAKARESKDHRIKGVPTVRGFEKAESDFVLASYKYDVPKDKLRADRCSIDIFEPKAVAIPRQKRLREVTLRTVIPTRQRPMQPSSHQSEDRYAETSQNK